MTTDIEKICSAIAEMKESVDALKEDGNNLKTGSEILSQRKSSPLLVENAVEEPYSQKPLRYQEQLEEPTYPMECG